MIMLDLMARLSHTEEWLTVEKKLFHDVAKVKTLVKFESVRKRNEMTRCHFRLSYYRFDNFDMLSFIYM